MQTHSLFRRFVSLLLATLVLIASVGLTVQRQTCRMSGSSQVAVSVTGQAALSGCAATDASVSVVAEDDDCCDFSTHLHKVPMPAHALAGKVLLPAPLLAVWEPATGWLPQAPAVAVQFGTCSWFAADSSPPLAGRALLAFCCKLVV
ncbi:HYC_CC_PP family protein [Hymenobacter arizonensis]|uniref:Uncharacterized protein n=1 Tax=Hymenobacter arizonensis TaxID=1227077 RepID=A0A1I5UWT5_HYMAR|nr:hypothetical protein [Hymenobacter arizonensis]SFP99662.1 hypothetical protein SAMN04515668_1103 [Hymenobacter arizonensis]